MPDIEALLNDPEFLQLPEEDQNELIDEMKQRDFGVIPKAENVLTRALKATTPSMTSGIGMANPLAPLMTARTMKEDVVNKNVKNPFTAGLVNFATDPLTYGGGFGAAKGASAVAKAPKQMFGSAGFGKRMAKLQSKSPDSRVNYMDIISRHSDDPVVKKVIDKSGVMEKFGGSVMEEGGAVSEKLKNLSLQDSQDFLNALKDEVRQAVKVGNIKPKELGVSRMFSDLVKAQDAVFQGFKGARRTYGLFKNVGKGIKRAAPWAGYSAAGTVAHWLTKKILPK